MTVVKAAVCHEFGKPFVIEEVCLRDPEAGEVEVRVEACAICHSDIAFADGGWGGSLPAVYGHEAAGRVTALGPAVEGYAIGDPVIVTLLRACGGCPSCSNGLPAICETPYDRATGPLTTASGERLEQGLATGAFAERVVVDISQIAPIPASMPMDAACLLSCGVITGVGAVVNTAQVRAGQTVVVIGAGGVGLNAIQGARIAGASRIIAIDMIEEKLEVAAEFGATDGVLASTEKPYRTVRELTHGRGADVVIVTVGAIAAIESAGRYLAPAGRVILVGMPHSGEFARFEPVVMAAVGQGMVGSKMGDALLRRDIPWMVDLYEQGRLKLDELVSGRWSLDQINDAIAHTRSGKARRNVIIFD